MTRTGFLRASLLLGIATFAAALGTAPALAQSGVQPGPSVPQMRSRLMTSLTGYEVTEYLKRNAIDRFGLRAEPALTPLRWLGERSGTIKVERNA